MKLQTITDRSDSEGQLETRVKRFLPRVAYHICEKINDYFFYKDIQQEIVLAFLESEAEISLHQAFVFGWKALEKFRIRNEITYSDVTKFYEGEFNIEEAIMKLRSSGLPCVIDRRQNFYNEKITRKIWELRAGGRTFKEIGESLNINQGTAEKYFRRSVYDESIPTGIKYKAMRNIRRRNHNKGIIMGIVSQLKSTTKSLTQIAREFDVQTSTVSRVNNGKEWGWLCEKYPIRRLARQTISAEQQNKMQAARQKSF